ncbi:MAG TPA: aminotransferase class V-fold PLP-dependent enzyme [Actinomycetales bacterium]|nr:aminotransferase class V-fold PLP-dependent enzyme [Actinomycetales bacterium]
MTVDTGVQASDDEPSWVQDAPLMQAWCRFVDAGPTPFTIPGHKRRAHLLSPLLGRLLESDVPLYGGADTMKLSAGVLAEAERRGAQLWDVPWCRYSTGGSTHANQVMCLAVGRPGDTVLVARNAHRSVVSGLVLAGLRPVWLTPATDPRFGIPTGVTVQDVETALLEHPEAVAVFLVEPSYLGTLSDIAGIVAVAHRRDVPVVVDQAWAAHLGFTEPYPPHALQLGADALVTSAHKALPAYSQASIVLARLDRLDPDRLERAFEAEHTTSPSATVLASTDASRALLATDAGRALVRRTADLVAGARERLRASGLVVPGPEDFAPGRFDPAKLVLVLGPTGRSGLDVEQHLLHAGIPVEMADRDTLVAMVSMLDDESTVGRFVTEVVGSLRDAGPARPVSAVPVVLPPQRCSPREAFFSAHESVPREAALGRVSAELVAPYPPGVPVLVPGEEVTTQTLDALDRALAAGNRIAYAADSTLRQLQVVRESPTA